MALLAVLGAGLLGTGLLAWRLAEGPLALPFLARRLEALAASRGVVLRVGELAVAWDGFRGGTERPLVLRLRDTHADARDGRPILDLRSAELTLSLAGLLHGRLLARTVSLEGATVDLVREPDGTVHLPGLRLAPDAAPPPDDRPDLVRLLRELTAPAPEDGLARGPLGQLRAATLGEVLVRVQDRQLGTPWRVEDLRVSLRRQGGGGVSGTAGATLALGEAPGPAGAGTAQDAAMGAAMGGAAPPGSAPAAPAASAPAPSAPTPAGAAPAPMAVPGPPVRAALTLEAALRPDGTALDAALTPVSPAALAAAAPGLAALGALDAPVGLRAAALLDPTLRPSSASLRAVVGAGTLRLGRGAVALRGGGLALDGTTLPVPPPRRGERPAGERPAPAREAATRQATGPTPAPPSSSPDAPPHAPAIPAPNLSAPAPFAPALSADIAPPAETEGGRPSAPDAAAGAPPPGLLRLHDARLELAPPPGAHAPAPTLRLEGELRPAARGFALQARLGLDQLGFADLRHYWPEGVAGDARSWVTNNVTAGTAHDGRLQAGLLLAPDLSEARLTGLAARVAGEDLTASWLRPVPPVEHAAAVLTLLNPDALEVAVIGGRDAGLRLAGATVRVTGLQARDQATTIAADLSGSVHDAVALLSHPRLHLLSRHPLPFRDPSGSFSGHLQVALPLRSDLDADQISLRYALRLSALHLGEVALGRSLDAGELALEGSGEGLEAHGTARLGGLPGTVTVGEDFRDGPPAQLLTRAALAVSATADELEAAGLDAGGMVHGGPVALAARYAERRDGAAAVSLEADLSAASLEAPTGWRKPAGAAAGGSGRILLDHGRLRGAEGLRLDGPGLRLRARLDTGGAADVLRVEELALGRTRVSGEVELPRAAGAPVRARLSGPLLDLSPRLDPAPAHAGAAHAGAAAEAAEAPAPPGDAAASAAASGAGVPWSVDARLERVLLGEGRVLAPVAVQVEGRGGVLRVATLRGGAGAPAAALSATLSPAPPPAPAGERRLVVDAPDAGALLAGLDVLHDVRGGHLLLDAVLAPPGGPRSPRRIGGTATVTDFSVTDAPAIGRLLQAATLYGLADLAYGPGLHLGRLVLPFRLEGDLLQLHDARATSASLGVTAHGTLDLARRTARLEGTVVPAWFLNQLPSRIPLLGRLFSAEPGGGLFAATFTLHGPLDDPAVTVNPLATLAPGALRGLLGRGE